jgi:transposase
MDLPVLHPRRAGLDVHKQTVVACACWVDPAGVVRHRTRTFATMTRDLQALGDWLATHNVTVVVLESTGS